MKRVTAAALYVNAEISGKSLCIYITCSFLRGNAERNIIAVMTNFYRNRITQTCILRGPFILTQLEPPTRDFLTILQQYGIARSLINKRSVGT